MSTEFDRGLRSWTEVTSIWNVQENRQDRMETIKEAGLQALKKLRILMEAQGKTYEDMRMK